MWTCRAPSNIALIKYMGKEENNVPCNASLSYTLQDYWTEVSLEKNDTRDVFINTCGFLQLGVDKFLSHLRYIKRLFGCNEYFTVRSRNNFPHSAGIASSASSFAALTKCAVQAIGAQVSVEQLGDISRHGSGSSCRSFISPWCIWTRNGIFPADIKIQQLQHELILIEKQPKSVSSSQAHELVTTSLLFTGRRQRAERRLLQLVQALNSNEWTDAFQICWDEFCDMHALFATAHPHFGYIKPRTLSALDAIDCFWRAHQDGPLVTIDAGPNIHLLWRLDQTQLRAEFKKCAERQEIKNN